MAQRDVHPPPDRQLPCACPRPRAQVATYHYDIKPVMAVEEGNGLQVALSNQSLDLLTTEWKLYLVQVRVWFGGGLFRR